MNGLLCDAGRIGWSTGNIYSSCNAACPEGYACPAGTKLEWPAKNAAQRVDWSAYRCGASKSEALGSRFKEGYGAKVYCPTGSGVPQIAPPRTCPCPCRRTTY